MRHYAWLLGLRSVIQHARRNLATALAIGFGYLALILVFGYQTRVSDYFAVSTIFLQQSGHITVFKKDGMRKRLIRPAKYSLEHSNVRAIESALHAMPAYDFSAGYMIGSGLIGNGCASFLFSGQGFVPEVEARIQSHPTVLAVIPELDFIEKGDLLWKNPTKNQLSVGSGMARKLGKSAVGVGLGSDNKAMPNCDTELSSDFAKDSSVQLLVRDYNKRISAVDADVSSIFKSGLTQIDSQLVQMPLNLMQELFDSDSLSYLAIFLKDEEKAPQVAEHLRATLDKAGTPIDAYVWSDVRLNPNYVNGMAVLNVSLTFVTLIVLVVVLLSILNTLTIGLAESRREIGTLRAIGYKPRQVAAIFAVESFVVCLASIIFGSILSQILVSVIASQKIPFRLPGLTYSTTFQVTPTLENYLQCSFLLMTLVLVVTIWKSRSYAKQGVLTLLDPGG